MKVINLFGGPGIGKSTIAMLLSAKMKLMHLSVEYVTEYAKDMVWEGRKNILSDQLYITAKQNRKLERIKDKVNYAVSDCPLLLGIHYATPDYLPGSYSRLVFELWNQYDNINFLLMRESKYEKIGRYQTEEEALQIDVDIKDLLTANQVPFFEVPGKPESVEKIVEIVRSA